MRGSVKRYLLFICMLCMFLFVVGCTADSQTDSFSDSVTLTPTVSVAETSPTDPPVPTEAPVLTEMPSPTEAPESTEHPIQTEKPELTEPPVPTEAPVPAETPVPSATLSPTPIPSSMPEPTETPLPTVMPEPTEAPLPTVMPEPTKVALPTPTPTKIPMPTPTPAPLLNYSSFYAGVFNVYSLAGHYADGVTNIDWVSSDPSILQVRGNDLIGIYPGETTITGTYKGTTVTADVTVYDCGIKGDDVSIQTQSICLFPGESFRLIATQKNAVFTSADPSVATVSSDGTVTARSIGTTTVTARNSKNSINCTVTVVADDGTYLKSSLDTEYPLTRERTVLESDSFYLIADIGVYLPEDILDKIELIMATMEKETGLSFDNPKLASEYGTLTKPAITVVNASSYDYAYGGADGVTVSPYDIYLDENGTHVLVHELMHTLQLRNGVDIGKALSEGFAIYYGGLICDKLPYPKNHDEYYNEWGSMGSFDEITPANTESLLLNPPDVHPFSYFFVRYLDETYGKDKFYEIMDAITEAVIQAKGAAYAGQMNPLSEEAIYKIIKEHTGDDLTEGFYRYFSSLEEADRIYMDLSDVDGVYYVDFEGNRRGNYTSIGGKLRFNQEITLDYTYAFDFAEKVWGRKAKGISLRAYVIDENHITHEVDTTFYDQYGNIIPISDPYEAFQNVAPGAVKVKLSGVDECICNARDDNMFCE